MITYMIWYYNKAYRIGEEECLTLLDKSGKTLIKGDVLFRFGKKNQNKDNDNDT